MKVKKFLVGGKFSQYQHMVVLVRETDGVFPAGGGYPESILQRFGEKRICHVSVYENIVRIEIKE